MESIVKQLREACAEQDGIQFYESYSGRGMHGDKCVGIVGSMAACMGVIAFVIANLTQEVFDAAYDNDDSDREALAAHELNYAVQDTQVQLLNFSYDSMGLDTIVYWRDIEPEPEEINLPTDDDIDAMSMHELANLLKDTWADYLAEEDEITIANIRAMAKIVRDRVKEDLPD